MDDIDALKSRIEELERDVETKDEELAMLSSEGSGHKAEDIARIEDLQRKLKEKETQLQQIVVEKNIGLIKSEFPDIDIELVTGENLEGMKVKAQKLQDMVNKAKETTKKQTEEELIKSWGSAPKGGGKQTFGSQNSGGNKSKEDEIAETLEKSQDLSDNILGLMAKQGVVKAKA